MYDGELEYWVTLKEKGSKEESVSKEQIQRSQEATQFRYVGLPQCPPKLSSVALLLAGSEGQGRPGRRLLPGAGCSQRQGQGCAEFCGAEAC